MKSGSSKHPSMSYTLVLSWMLETFLFIYLHFTSENRAKCEILTCLTHTGWRVSCPLVAGIMAIFSQAITEKCQWKTLVWVNSTAETKLRAQAAVLIIWIVSCCEERLWVTSRTEELLLVCMLRTALAQEKIPLVVPSSCPGGGWNFSAIAPSDRAVLCWGHLVAGRSVIFCPHPIKYRDDYAVSLFCLGHKGSTRKEGKCQTAWSDCQLALWGG